MKVLKNIKRYLSYQKPNNNFGHNSKIDIDSSVNVQDCTFNINGIHNTIKIKKNVKLRDSYIYISGNNNTIEIDQDVKFNGKVELWLEDNYCKIEIGNKTTIEGAHIAVTEDYSSISIGNDCMLSSNIDIRTGDSHSIIDIKTKSRINYAKDVIIGDHVWIGSKVSILKGAKLPNNSIVATQSIVTKQFLKENVIIGGSPAKQIKEGIDWQRERIK